MNTRPSALGQLPVPVTIYARYSSDLQRPTSIEDQVRNCRTAASEKGYIVLDACVRSDAAVSGRSLQGRDGLSELIELAKSKACPFQGILIDDTSRFGRYLPDVLREADVLKHYGVFVYFVSQRLDSRDSAFQMALLFAGYADQQYVAGLSQKVHRGQLGRVLAGFSPGGRCYGYRNVPVEDGSRRGEYGRPAVIGVAQEVLPEQAEVVRRIFGMYAAGASYATVAKTLNKEGIRSPQVPRSKNKRGWCPTAIREMLLNDRYRGVRVWNRTQYVLNPDTGKTEERSRPESEWVIYDDESLRIVSDELWKAAREQNERVREKHGPKRVGGMNRTANSRRYIFSGLLECGSCGVNMTITSGKAPYSRYGCPNHRYRGTCSNALTIQQTTIEKHLIAALSRNVLAPEKLESHVKALRSHLTQQLESMERAEQQVAANRGELQRERKELTAKASNIAEAISLHGYSAILSAQLKDLEARLEHIDELLNVTRTPEQPHISDDELRDFLTSNMARLQDLLLADPATAKHELQKRIGRLVLTPRLYGTDGYYEVSGDVSLFAPNTDVLQNSSPRGIGEHYSPSLKDGGMPPISFSCRLVTLTFPTQLEIPPRDRHEDFTMTPLLTNATQLPIPGSEFDWKDVCRTYKQWMIQSTPA